MDNLIRAFVQSNRVWGASDRDVDLQPPDMADDYAARVIALLVERLGGSGILSAEDIKDVPSRLVLLPRDSGGLELQVRRLAR